MVSNCCERTCNAFCMCHYIAERSWNSPSRHSHHKVQLVRCSGTLLLDSEYLVLQFILFSHHCHLSFTSSFTSFLQNALHLNATSLLIHCAWSHCPVFIYHIWTSVSFMCKSYAAFPITITQLAFLLYPPWVLYYEHCLVCVPGLHIFKLNDISCIT